MIPPFKVVVCVLPFASYSDNDNKLWYPNEIWDEYTKVLSFIRGSSISVLGSSTLFFCIITPSMLFYNWNGPLAVLVLHPHRSYFYDVSPSSSLIDVRYVRRGKYTNYNLVWYNHWLSSLLYFWYYKVLSVASNLQTIFGIVDNRIRYLCLLMILHSRNYL